MNSSSSTTKIRDGFELPDIVRIVSIASHTTPNSETPIPSNGAANGVLELRAGRASEIGAKPGDKVLHPYFKP
jgi:uncharacterized membrane protein (UPF0127 family)